MNTETMQPRDRGPNQNAGVASTADIQRLTDHLVQLSLEVLGLSTRLTKHREVIDAISERISRLESRESA